MTNSQIHNVSPERKAIVNKLSYAIAEMQIMTKNYVYRMDHDNGCAPRIENDNFCFLSGCKMNTVESWAKEGSWVIGIGGNGTHKPDKIIYAMKVDRNMTMPEFMQEFPEKKEHIINDKASHVLLSTEFYYLGDKALSLPATLEHLVIRAQGCKKFNVDTVKTLKNFLQNQGIKHGKNGNPNNPKPNNTMCSRKPC